MQVPAVMYTSPTFRYDRDIQQMIVQYRAASTGEVSLQIPAPIDVRTLRAATVSPVIAAVLEMMDPLSDETAAAPARAATTEPPPSAPAATAVAANEPAARAGDEVQPTISIEV